MPTSVERREARRQRADGTLAGAANQNQTLETRKWLPGARSAPKTLAAPIVGLQALEPGESWRNYGASVQGRSDKPPSG